MPVIIFPIKRAIHRMIHALFFDSMIYHQWSTTSCSFAELDLGSTKKTPIIVSL